MPDESVHSEDDQRLWTLLGAVELTYHPALAIALLLAVDAVVSPVPAVLFDPLSITVTGQGVSITTLFAVVVLVDLVSDVVSVSDTGWTRTLGDGDE